MITQKQRKSQHQKQIATEFAIVKAFFPTLKLVPSKLASAATKSYNGSVWAGHQMDPLHIEMKR
jgi:hypothetical protein